MILRKLQLQNRFRSSGLKLSTQLRNFTKTNFYCYAQKTKVVKSTIDIDNELVAATELPLLDWDRGGRTQNEALTPLYASMKILIDANPGCVCLIQVGSFYELYFEQAEIYGPKLGLKVATRKTNSYSIPMAGFPTYQLQKFVKSLVQDLEQNVAIIDQYPLERRINESIIHRKISRIVSPGTLVDETFLNYNQNNYLVAIAFPAKFTKTPADLDLCIGLSWIDISVGEFYVQQTTLGELIADISRINPSEIIISKEFQEDNLTSGQWHLCLQDLRKYFIRYHKTVYKDLKLQFKTNLQTTRKKLESFSIKEEMAMNMVLSYINVNLPDTDPTLDLPIQYWNEDRLQMDARTREALELTERSTGGHTSVVGSLLTTIKRTITPSGTRLLTQWLKSPILDVSELRSRQEFVILFKENNYLKLSLRTQLTQLGDFIRSVQRLVFGTGDIVAHLQYIGDGLTKLESLHSFLKEEAKKDIFAGKVLDPFLKQFKVSRTVAEKIFSTLNVTEIANHGISETDQDETEELDESSTSYSNSNQSIEKYKGIRKQNSELGMFFSVRKDYDPILKEAHNKLDELMIQESNLIKSIRTQIQEIDSKLTIIKKSQHGRYINVLYISGKQKLIDEAYKLLSVDIRERRKGSLLYKPESWGKLQALIDEQIDIIKESEKEIIDALRQEVLNRVSEIRNVSKLVDYLDVTSSFAILAEENNLVCPKFVKTPQLNIVGGRHIVVESGLKSVSDMFIPNDTKVGSDDNLWVISGPNMGGKSTYLRQNALIVILAQIGSFVPATKASIGIVDKIFTRIGASDDLYSDLSTFMVEMVETSNILKNATPRSLAIVDEIGRGTSGKEGLAIAYATLLDLLHVNKCRTLFATHFGKELQSLLLANNVKQDKIRYYRTKVLHKDTSLEDGNYSLIIDHALEPGISDRSYALEVAKMAGFPESALSKAREALKLIK